MPSATTAATIGSASRLRQPGRWSTCDASLMERVRSRTPTHRLSGPHERAHEFAVDVGDRRGAESGAGENVASALGRVDPGRLHVDILEAAPGELGAILALFERADDAPDPQLDTAADRRRHLPAHDHVGDGEPSTRLQHAKRLGQHRVLVGGQIDDAVRDDDIYRIVREWDVLDLAL